MLGFRIMGESLNIGKFNLLKVSAESEHGLYLDGGQYGDILLPLRYVPESCQVGDEVEVFVCYDSQDRLIAIREKPNAQVGEFAFLKVVAIERVGAFLDWGLPKDLFLPFSEQTKDLAIGEKQLVYIYLDKTERISSSMRVEKYLSKEKFSYKIGDPVDLVVFAKSPLGYKALINFKHLGMLYQNEVFQDLQCPVQVPGYIKNIREDAKIDLILQPLGYTANDEISAKILDLLVSKGGFIAINDKTSAEVIHELFGISKKKYKMALGGLYKKRLIKIHEDGIHLST